MKGYAIKQRLTACLFGLSLLAGCTQFPCTPEAQPARKYVTAQGPRPACRSGAAAPYSVGFPCAAASACATVPATSKSADPACCECPPGTASKVVAVMVEQEAIAPALRIAPTPVTAKRSGCYQPCTLGEPCLPCSPCPPCPTVYDCPPAAATVSFQPVPGPARLPDIGPGADAGHVLPAPEAAPRRRSFVDLTAAACFAHAPDYSWVSGQVEYSGVRKEWRLRYASVDETDRFGGRLVLIENEHLAYLADGQYVRAQGRLVSPSDPAGRTAFYRIEAFQRIDKPNRLVPPTAN